MHAQQEPDRSRVTDRPPGSPVLTDKGTGAAQTAAGGPGGPMTPGRLLALQRSVGNAAAAGMVAQGQQDRHEHDARCGHAPAVQRSTVHDVLSTPGLPFTGPLAQRVSDHYGGVDLSHVRLHTDAVAQRSAEEIGARAYTSGNHIVMGRDATEKDARHEAFHIFQQAAGEVSGTDAGNGLKVSERDAPEEKAAEAAAETPHHAPDRP